MVAGARPLSSPSKEEEEEEEEASSSSILRSSWLPRFVVDNGSGMVKAVLLGTIHLVRVPFGLPAGP